MSVTDNSSWMYKPVIIHRQNNLTDAATPIDFVGQSLPEFPHQEMSTGLSTNFYLRDGGTINITTVNATGSSVTFMYQVKDTALGYSIAESWSYVSQASVFVPRDRNYSIMIYPNQSLPVSFNWNNFSSASSYNVSTTNRSKYNATTYKLDKEFNTSLTLVRINGSIFNSTGQNLAGGWNEFTIIPFILEPGNMVYLGDNAAMPYNMSAWNETPYSDAYSLALGNFSITVPAPVETTTYMFFATARNGTNYYGGYRNISLTYGSGTAQVNFTMYPLMSTDWASATSNFTLNKATDWSQINISSARKGFNLVNASSNATLTQTQAHIELTVDYTNYNATEFTFMLDTSQTGAASFYIPLINSTGVKEINIYSQSFAPKTVSARTATQIISNSNISMSQFNPGDIDGRDISDSLYISLYISNSTCDVPSPVSSCVVGSSANMDNFNPLGSIIGGGKLSFRMGLTASGILVHYVNVDMMASGPPDALFDDSVSEATSSGFDSAMRFGSSGPTIYDYVLISMPYTEGSSSQTGLNESAQVNMSIPFLYDENWNLIWNNSVNGTNGTLLAGNYSHYNTYSSQWETLMGNNTCVTNVSIFNSTNPCYKDTTNNRIWIRLPHFSGTKPSVEGSLISATAASTTSSGGGGGSSSLTSASTWKYNYFEDDKELSEKGEISMSIAAKSRVKLKIKNETHYVGISEVSSSKIIVNISSEPQIATLSLGDLRRFEVTGDNYYDLSVRLNSINSTSGKADISILSINELVTEETKTEEQKKETVAKGEEIVPSEVKKSNFKRIILGIIIAVVVLIVLFIFVLRKNKKIKKK